MSVNAQFRYYLSLSWWIIKLSILIFLFIPGTIPMIIGFIVSFVYTLFDPQYILLNYALEMYKSSIMTWSIITQIFFYNGIVLLVIGTYILILKKRNKGKTLYQISKDQFEGYVRKLKKPENPSYRPNRE